MSLEKDSGGGQEFNPYTPPASSLEAAAAPKLKAPGINRPAFMLLFVLIGIVVDGTAKRLGIEPQSLTGQLILGTLLTATTYPRFKNIGMSPHLAWLGFVPFVGGLLLIPCTLCQPRYTDTKRLDKAAYGIIAAFILLLILAIGTAVLIPLLEAKKRQRDSQTPSAAHGY